MITIADNIASDIKEKYGRESTVIPNGVEIPLKAIVRGFSHATVPVNWHGRESGLSKYKLRILQRKYFFSLLYVLLERILLKDEMKETK